MDWLYSLLDNSSLPVVTALILGILTAVSPCPLATTFGFSAGSPITRLGSVLLMMALMRAFTSRMLKGFVI